MAEAFTSYVLANDIAFKEALEAAKEVVSDLRVPFGLIGKDFYRSEKAIFSLKSAGQYPPFKKSVAVASLGGKGNSFGRRRAFATLSESPYQRAKKAKYGFDYPLLVRTGLLANSVLGPNNPGSVFVNSKQALIIGTSVKYGIYHQSDSPRKVIPLRKFIFIGPEAQQFATSDQMGRLERWTGYITDYVISQYIKKGFANG
jgi:phage gpG-like protein